MKKVDRSGPRTKSKAVRTLHLLQEGLTPACVLRVTMEKPVWRHHRSCLMLASLRSKVTPLPFRGPSLLFPSFSA